MAEYIGATGAIDTIATFIETTSLDRLIESINRPNKPNND